MLDALDAAQRRGVAVNLLIDGFGQRLGGVLMSPADRAALACGLDALRRAGAVVTIYRPRHRLQRWLGGGQHVKIQVSEAGEALFGSSNLTRSSFEGWNEYAVALRGPVVRTLLESYRDDRRLGRGVAPRASLTQAVARTADAGGPPARLLAVQPQPPQGPLGPLGWRGPNLVTDRLVERIDRRHGSRSP